MFCKKCGKEIFDDNDYCEECKSASHAVIETDKNSSSQKKKCCPKCKSRHLQIVTNTEYSSQTKGGGYSTGKGCCGYILLGPLGLLCGGMGNKSKTTVTSKSTTIWNCLDCGNKFRDIADIESDIESTSKRAKIGQILLPIYGIFMFIMFIISRSIILAVAFLAISIVASIIVKNSANNRLYALHEEKKDIEKNGYTD